MISRRSLFVFALGTMLGLLVSVTIQASHLEVGAPLFCWNHKMESLPCPWE